MPKLPGYDKKMPDKKMPDKGFPTKSKQKMEVSAAGNGRTKPRKQTS